MLLCLANAGGAFCHQGASGFLKSSICQGLPPYQLVYGMEWYVECQRSMVLALPQVCSGSLQLAGSGASFIKCWFLCAGCGGFSMLRLQGVWRVGYVFKEFPTGPGWGCF